MKSFKDFFGEGVKKLDFEFILSELADKDINGWVDEVEKTIYVDKSDVKEAQKIIKKLGFGKEVKVQAE